MSVTPISTSQIDDHHEHSVDYPFAIEYNGPPISYDIPQVVPVGVQKLPTAETVFSSYSLVNNLSLPVKKMQPNVKTDHSREKLEEGSKVGAEAAELLVSVSVSTEFPGSRCNSVDINDQEGPLDGLRNDDRCAPSVLDGTGSSLPLRISDSPNASNEISVTLTIEDSKEEPGMESTDHGGHADLQFEDYNSCSSAACSEFSISGEVEDCTRGTSYSGSGTSVVAFCDSQSSDVSTEDVYLDEPDKEVDMPVRRSDVTKGTCYLCFKGNRFTEKEVCIVCGAKYCSSCVLRAMGSMPEGRKCITCVGFPINESKREYLGKSSKIIKRLLPEWEIEEIMRLEVEANRLRPDLVYINDRPLSLQELVLLQTCSNPPKKLKPGRYWYDRVSGLWGKEGRQPHQIISPNLNIGGIMKQNASDGNGNVLINGREITRKEVWMLQMAGVHCEGQPHLWIFADGLFQYEGQRCILGRLWDTPGINFICAALSLPIPPQSCDEVEKEGNKGGQNNLFEKVLHPLVVGYDESGTSTISEQAEILYDIPFSEYDEHQNIKFIIQANLYHYIGILLEPFKV